MHRLWPLVGRPGGQDGPTGRWRRRRRLSPALTESSDVTLDVVTLGPAAGAQARPARARPRGAAGPAPARVWVTACQRQERGAGTPQKQAAATGVRTELFTGRGPGTRAPELAEVGNDAKLMKNRNGRSVPADANTGGVPRGLIGLLALTASCTAAAFTSPSGSVTATPPGHRVCQVIRLSPAVPRPVC